MRAEKIFQPILDVQGEIVESIPFTAQKYFTCIQNYYNNANDNDKYQPASIPAVPVAKRMPKYQTQRKNKNFDTLESLTHQDSVPDICKKNTNQTH